MTTSKSKANTVQVNVKDLEQLFESWDPFPFNERDLNSDAEEYIVASIKEADTKPNALIVYLNQSAGSEQETIDLEKAIRAHFARRAELKRWELRRLIRRGLISLVIGLSFLVCALAGGELLKKSVGGHIANVLGETLHIAGYVAMWHPLEIFLYEWWPILGDYRLYLHLSKIPVRIDYIGHSRPIKISHTSTR